MLARQPALLLAAKATGRTTLGVETDCHQYNATDGWRLLFSNCAFEVKSRPTSNSRSGKALPFVGDHARGLLRQKEKKKRKEEEKDTPHSELYRVLHSDASEHEKRLAVQQFRSVTARVKGQ